MSQKVSTPEIDYPESDGKPMGETDLHRDVMVRLIDLLRQRYRGQRVYVSGDLLIYYEEGDPSRHVAPDVFVVKDCEPHRRTIYKLWEERLAPSVAIEVTSRSTRREDTMLKPRVFSLMGIPEYFAYDPTSDYLHPPLQGFRLEQGEYVTIAPAADGSLESQQLDLVLRLEGGAVQLHDRATDERLLTEAELEQRAKEQERARREAAEAEVKRLRKLLEQQGGSDDL